MSAERGATPVVETHDEARALRAEQELADARKWQEHYELAASDRAGELADARERIEDLEAALRGLLRLMDLRGAKRPAKDAAWWALRVLLGGPDV